MRTSVERYKYSGYTDFELWHLLKALMAFFWSSVVCALLFLPIIAMGSILSTTQTEGFRVTAVYLFSVFVSTVMVYVLCLMSALNGLMFTTDKKFYIFNEVPSLVKNQRSRFLNGLTKATVIPLVLLAVYWFMVQRIPIVLPPYGVFIFCAIISGTFALRDSYRMYRDNLTIIDSFGLLMPKKMLQAKKGKLNKVPMLTFGSGVLFAPFLQSFFLSVAAMFIAFAYGGNDTLSNSRVLPWAFVVSFGVAFTMWGILFRLFDTFKPWGEKGQLSILKHGDGSIIQERQKQ